MTNARSIRPLLAIAIAASAGLACAQTTVAPNPAPATVGVSQGTAVNAETKAVPRSDTGTLVRTDTKARRMAARASAADAMAPSSVGNAIDNVQAATPRARHTRN